MREHTIHKCNCNKTGYQFCDGGLSCCNVCGCFEGMWTSECPGRRITEEEGDKIYKEGTLDFIDGEWKNQPSPHSPAFYRINK